MRFVILFSATIIARTIDSEVYASFTNEHGCLLAVLVIVFIITDMIDFIKKLAELGEVE